MPTVKKAKPEPIAKTPTKEQEKLWPYIYRLRELAGDDDYDIIDKETGFIVIDCDWDPKKGMFYIESTVLGGGPQHRKSYLYPSDTPDEFLVRLDVRRKTYMSLRSAIKLLTCPGSPPPFGTDGDEDEDDT